jgi:5-formyltetrahydrofolate cyclo-ligase
VPPPGPPSKTRGLSGRWGQGKGYDYAPDHPGHFVVQDYPGADKRYYEPAGQGVEQIKERLDKWRAQVRPRGEGRREGSSVQETIRAAKRALREQVGARLKGLGGTERAAGSAQARARLAAQPLWQKARSVLFFAPLPEEVDVWPLLTEALAEGKQVALPRFDAERKGYEACAIQDPAVDLQPGHFGIREPSGRCARLADARLDLILVPGVAFDLLGGRLGRGKAYYDRLLAVVRGLRCAVAFDEQLVEAVPVEPHDMRMDYILTPRRWMELRAAS